MGRKRSHSKEDSHVKEKKRRLREYNSSSSSEDERVTRNKSDKKHLTRPGHKSKSKVKHKKKKRKVYTESTSSDETSRSEISCTPSSEKSKRKKQKKAKRKLKKFKHKKVKNETEERMTESDDLVSIGPLPTEGLSEKAKSMAPMTKEEWEKRQCVVKRVFDEETGRDRLVKGDGEILEEIVSRDRHKEINRQATARDGSFFQNKIHNKFKFVITYRLMYDLKMYILY